MMITAAKRGSNVSTTLVLKNMPCPYDLYNNIAQGSYSFPQEECRYYTMKEFQPLTLALAKQDAISAAFFDFGEHG